MKTFREQTNLTAVLFFLFITACGLDPKAITTSDTAATEDTKKQELTTSDYFIVEGYVSPINISVNNKSYLDSEDFFTQEVKRLKAEVNKEFPEHSLFFDADVGLRDFKQNLSVFIVSSSDTGVASESAVDNKGKFTFNLPSDVDTQQLYTIRASKRIGLRLVKDQDVVSWCYNLFAENEVTLDGKSLILRKFKTVVTSYKCEEKKEESIAIPNNPYNYVTEAFETGVDNGYGPVPKAANKAVIEPVKTIVTASTEDKANSVVDALNK